MFVPQLFMIVLMSLLNLPTCQKRVMFQITEFKSNFHRNHPEFERIVISEPKKTNNDIDVLSVDEPKIPENIEYMFKGYNIFIGDPFAKIGPDPGHSPENIFIHQFEKNNKTTTSGIWLQSDTLSVMKVDTCDKRKSAHTITGETSYQKALDFAVSMEHGLVNISAQFSASFSYHDVSEQTHKKKNIMYSTEILCLRYSARTKINSNLDSAFIEEVGALPKTDPASESTRKEYYSLFDNFGTHYIKTAMYGSRLWIMSTISSDSYIRLSSQGMDLNNVAAAIPLKYLSSNTSLGSEINTNYFNEFSKNLIKEDISTRGSYMLSEDKEGQSWSERLKSSSPDPLLLTLGPISALFHANYFPDVPKDDLEAKKKILIELMKDYCNVYLKKNDCRMPKADEVLPPITLPSPKPKEPVYLLFTGPAGVWYEELTCGQSSSGDSPIISFLVYDYTTVTVIQKLNDDLRNIRVKFNCGNAKKLETPAYNYEGDTGEVKECPDGFTGAQTRIQPWIAGNDNVALVCLRMLCGESLLETKCHTDIGIESELKKCPEGTKITGVRAMFQEYVGWGDWKDDTALNGIQFTCT